MYVLVLMYPCWSSGRCSEKGSKAFETVPIKRGEVVLEQESIPELNSLFSNLAPG